MYSNYCYLLSEVHLSKMYQFLFRNTAKESLECSGELTFIQNSVWNGKKYSQADYFSKCYSTIDDMLVNYFFLIQLTGQLPFPRFFRNGVYITTSHSLYTAYVNHISSTNTLIAEKSMIV